MTQNNPEFFIFDPANPSDLKQLVYLSKKELEKSCREELGVEICGLLKWSIDGIMNNRKIKITIKWGRVRPRNKKAPEYGYNIYINRKKYASIILPYLGAPVEEWEVVFHRTIDEIIDENIF